MKTKRYTHLRHRWFLRIVQFLFGPFFKWYYRFNAKPISIKQGGPYLILSNHTSEFDIIFMDYHTNDLQNLEIETLKRNESVERQRLLKIFEEQKVKLEREVVERERLRRDKEAVEK